MTNPTPGTLAWFEVATSDPDAEQLGGTVVGKHLDPGPGAPAFAYLRDPAGNQFGVFSPPAG